MPHGNNLSQGYFRVAISQVDRQTGHRLAGSTAAGKTSSFTNEPSSVVATIGSILRQAERMSFRNEGSCRIDDPEVFKNFGAHPGFESSLGNEIDPASSQGRQLLSERFELDQSNTYSWLELHHDVDVAMAAHLAPDGRPEEGKLLDALTAAHLGE